MATALAVAGAGVVLGAWSHYSRPFDGVSGPQFSCPATIDLGRMDLSAIAQVRFDVRNDGDAPLIIHRVETDCHCKDVYIENEMIGVHDHVIPPGAVTRMGLTFMISGSIGDRRATTLRFYTNDPQRSSVEVVITYVPGACLYVVPAEIVRANAIRGEPQTFALELYADDRSPLVTTRALETSHPGLFVARFRPAPKDRSEPLENSHAIRIGTLELSTTGAFGNEEGFESTLRVLQNGLAVLTIPMRITFQSEYVLAPSSILLPRRSADKMAYECSVICRRGDGQPFTMVAQSTIADVAATAEATAPDGRSYVVKVLATDKERLSPLVGSVILKCTEANGKVTQLSIPVRIAAKDG